MWVKLVRPNVYMSKQGLLMAAVSALRWNIIKGEGVAKASSLQMAVGPLRRRVALRLSREGID